MSLDSQRARAIGVMGVMVSIDATDPRRIVLFDIYYQLQKILGKDNHTLAFQCAVDGVVYGVTVTREESGVICKLFAFLDEQEAQIHWPPVNRILQGVYATTNVRDGFDFKAFSTEIETLFGEIIPIRRRRLASMLTPADLAEDDSLEARARDAAELAGAYPDAVEPLEVPLGVSFSQPPVPAVGPPIRQRKSVVVAGLMAPNLQSASATRARLHTVFSGNAKDVNGKKTLILSGRAEKAIAALLGMRKDLEARNPREPLRKAWPQRQEHVLYVRAVAEGLWVYAGPVGMQNHNRIFIPYQLEGSYVKVAPDAPWDLIADMLGVR